MRDSKLAVKIVEMLFPGQSMDIIQRITPDEAKKQGMEVDMSCYPWLAYKGQRFNPTEAQGCLTYTEATLLDHVFQVFDVEDSEKMIELMDEVEKFALDLRTSEPQRSVLLLRMLLLVERLFHANELLDRSNDHLEDLLQMAQANNEDGSAAVH